MSGPDWIDRWERWLEDVWLDLWWLLLAVVVTVAALVGLFLV